MNDPKIQSLDDDSLEAVAAGTFIDMGNEPIDGTVVYDFQVGDVVDVKSGFSTVRCRITQLGADYDFVKDSNGVPQKTPVATYYCEKMESNLLFFNGWKDRDQIVTPSTK